MKILKVILDHYLKCRDVHTSPWRKCVRRPQFEDFGAIFLSFREIYYWKRASARGWADNLLSPQLFGLGIFAR